MRIILICGFLLLGESFAWAQANAGNVIVTGNVTIDGKAVQHSGNIFFGEDLKTGDGAATITSDGVVASMGSHVSVLYGKNLVDMECGWVDVATVKDFAVRVHDITATPSGGGMTKYEVKQNARQLSIHDFQGRVQVDDGKEKTLLNPGDTRTFERAARCAVPAGYAPWVAGGLFVASTSPIWADLSPHNRHEMTPTKP